MSEMILSSLCVILAFEPSLHQNGKWYSMESICKTLGGVWAYEFNMSRDYYDRRHAMDARAFGQRMAISVCGTSINAWEGSW